MYTTLYLLCILGLLPVGVVSSAVVGVSLSVGRVACEGGVREREATKREGEENVSMFVQRWRGCGMYRHLNCKDHVIIT